MMVQYSQALTSYHEPAIVQSHSSDIPSCLRQAGHQLPGNAPVLLQGLGGCQGRDGAGSTATHYIDLHNKS